jgi:DNA repair protein RecO (recombination protein O)
MTESTTGIILRTRPLTETSLIVHWLTPDLGRLATVAKGARRTQSPFRGRLDLFYEADFSFARSRRSDLHTLREVSLRLTHEALRTELGWLQQASYAATLIEQTTETETPLPGICELMTGFLKQLPRQPPRPRSLFAFELKLLRLLGQAPNPAETKLSKETQTLLTSLLQSPWDKLGELRATAAQARALEQFLHGFIIFHLGGIPAGRLAHSGDKSTALQTLRDGLGHRTAR